MKILKNMMGSAVLILLMLFTISGCGPSQRTLREDGETFFQNVYVPSDAIIINQRQQDDVVAAVQRNCKGIEISIIYGINRSADEVLNEYIESLFANGWHVDSWNENPTELPHFYKGDAFIGVYFVTPLDILAKSVPDQILPTEDYMTIYSIYYNYAVPASGDSEIKCHGR